MSLYDNVLADLCARFVINSPQESFQSWERLLFEVTPAHLAAHLWVIPLLIASQVELAWWYYTDFLIPQNPKQVNFTAVSRDIHDAWRFFQYSNPSFCSCIRTL
jgi:hypothetical protein